MLAAWALPDLLVVSGANLRGDIGLFSCRLQPNARVGSLDSDQRLRAICLRHDVILGSAVVAVQFTPPGADSAGTPNDRSSDA